MMIFKRFLLFTLSVFFCGVANAQQPTPLTYFGMHMHRLDSGTPWPPFQFGTWRLWDAYVGWPDLEPAPGQWNFKRLDLYVRAAEIKKVEPIYVLAHSPAWASARPAERAGYKPGYSAEPADIEHWRRYVRTVAERYKGRIKYYEVWNEPSDKNHFTGTPEKLLELIKVAHETLKAVDPAIQVISPANAGGGHHLKYLDNLFVLGANRYTDIVAYHFYVWRDDPEAMLPLIRQVREIMRKHGLADKPLWNTETGWWINNGDGTPDHPMVAKGGWRKLDANAEAGAMMARAFLLARSEGVERFIWYSWDNRYGLGMLEPTAMTPKPLAKHFEYLVAAMQGWAVNGCSAQGKVWSCRLEQTGQPSRLVLWAAEDAVTWGLPKNANYRSMRNLETNQDVPMSAGAIALGQYPVLLW